MKMSWSDMALGSQHGHSSARGLCLAPFPSRFGGTQEMPTRLAAWWNSREGESSVVLVTPQGNEVSAGPYSWELCGGVVGGRDPSDAPNPLRPPGCICALAGGLWRSAAGRTLSQEERQRFCSTAARWGSCSLQGARHSHPLSVRPTAQPRGRASGEGAGLCSHEAEHQIPSEPRLSPFRWSKRSSRVCVVTCPGCRALIKDRQSLNGSAGLISSAG